MQMISGCFYRGRMQLFYYFCVVIVRMSAVFGVEVDNGQHCQSSEIGDVGVITNLFRDFAEVRRYSAIFDSPLTEKFL